MDNREKFVKKHLHDRQARILELGPLNRPIVDKDSFPNCRYCDIRTTQEVKELYSGNAYLEQTGIWIDTETIVDIDDVICGTYSEFYGGKEKFDVVVASHVLEHMGDLIFSLQDIGKILKPNGIFCIVYPDMRYCFDHFRQSASFRDAYNVYRNGIERNAPMVLDFFLMSVNENNPFRFWGDDNLEALLQKTLPDNALRAFEEAENGIQIDDVHYWPFTDYGFLLFIYECTRMKLLPFKCIDFLATEENDQQFMVALKLDESVTRFPEEALEMLIYWIKQALPHFYTSNDKRLEMITQQQATQIVQLQAEVGDARHAAELLSKEKSVAQEESMHCRELIAHQEKLLSTQTSRISEQDTQLQLAGQQLMEHIRTTTKLLDQLNQARMENQTMQTEILMKGTEIDNYRNRVRAMESRIAELETMQAEILTKNAEIDNYRSQVRAMESRIVGLETIEHSRIWRMTGPLRALLDQIKRLF